ncbi:hypothetical protein LINPERPRIM_LOCUS29354 [Linum perenne]
MRYSSHPTKHLDMFFLEDFVGK